MSLHLDKRQRAMLREMGVRVWQPLAVAPVAPLPAAPEIIASGADGTSARGHFDQDNGAKKAFTPTVATPEAGPAQGPARPAGPPAAPAPPLPAETHGGRQGAWQLGEAQALYAPTARPGGGRWLVLAEAPAAALHRPVFEGDAGRLLDNMLRAARVHQADAVLFAPLVRHAAGTADEFSAALAGLIGRAQPDVVLVMGRLAAQALLRSSEPLGKLRGRVHALQGAKTIVTYDVPYLLRTPADKARAWDDLCLAMSLTAGAADRA